MGVAAQMGAVAAGALLLTLSTGLVSAPPLVRTAELSLGILLVYLNTHAIGHWAIGRAVGISFSGFGLRGTDHPEAYPFGLRQLMLAMPMWVAITVPASRRQASRWSLAAMYIAGETSTTLCTVAAAVAANLGNSPGGRTALLVVVVWNLLASAAVSVQPKGDYARAWRALRGSMLAERRT